MARTLQQQLDAVDALITELEGAQGMIETGTRDAKYVRERLQALYAERRELRKEVSRSQGGKFHLGRFKNP